MKAELKIESSLRVARVSGSAYLDPAELNRIGRRREWAGLSFGSAASLRLACFAWVLMASAMAEDLVFGGSGAGWLKRQSRAENLPGVLPA